MKTTFEILVIIAAMLFISCPTIHSNPFKISFERPYLAIGITCIMLGIVFIMLHTDLSTYKKGLGKGCEISREAAKQIILEQQKKQQ